MRVRARKSVTKKDKVGETCREREMNRWREGKGGRKMEKKPKSHQLKWKKGELKSLDIMEFTL